MSDFSNFPNIPNNFSDPVRVTEEASTFSESDVTMVTNNTTVSNGSIALSASETSGSVIIGFDSGVPADIDTWDLATYQITPDNETVTVEIGESVPEDLIISNFEDGDITTQSEDWGGWKGDTSKLSTQQNTVINGSFSGEFESSGEFVSISTERNSGTTDNAEITINIGSDVLNSDDFFRLSVEAASGSTLLQLDFIDGNGSIEEVNGGTVRSSWDAGTDYTIEFIWDFPNDQADIIINGTNEGTYSFNSSESDFAAFALDNRTSSSGNTRSVFIDDVLIPDGTFGFSGIHTDVSRDFDISPIVTDKNVLVRANLSRSDTANNPTLDYAARRFTR